MASPASAPNLLQSILAKPLKDIVFAHLESDTNNPIPLLIRREVAQLITDELILCGGFPNEHREDMGIFSALAGSHTHRRKLDLGAFVHALHFRGRQQMAVWNTYLALVEKGILDLKDLLVPIDLSQESTPAMDSVESLLYCVQCAWDEANAIMNDRKPYKLYYYGFFEPFKWLATMIARRCDSKDAEKILETIEESAFLGPRNEEAVATYRACSREKHWEASPREREPPPADENVACYGSGKGPFGFWLPHKGFRGVDEREALVRACTDHFVRVDRIEEAAKRYFGLEGDQEPLEGDLVP